VSKPSYRVRSGKLTVSWKALRHASYFYVQIRLAHGNLRYQLAGSSRGGTFTLAPGTVLKGVTVTAAAAGLTGPAVKAKPPVSRRRQPKHK
jgi:hypothetical protein